MDSKEIIKELLEINKEYDYFNTLDAENIEFQITSQKNKGNKRLSGQFIPVKDALCVKDVESRAGSSILDGYKPVFDATVIEKIRKESGIIAGKQGSC